MFKIISSTKSQFIKQLPWARYYFKHFYVLQYAMGWIMSPPKTNVEALTHSVTVFGYGASKEVINIKWGWALI